MRVRQHGVAIVLAMGVVALAAIAAVAIVTSQSTWSRQTELSGDRVQAQAVLQAGADWARAILSDDLRAGNVDHLGEPWALKLPPMQVENGELVGQIEDQQGAFNLNNLVAEGKVSVAHLAQYRRLLSILGLPAELADTLADWIDADGEPQPRYGAEDGYYLSLEKPYLAANRPLTDLSELALVRGYGEAVRTRLRPYAAALPRLTTINVNTASAEVLAAAIDGLDYASARVMVAQRERAYFRSVDDFVKRLPYAAAPASGDLSVQTSYFLATLRVTIGGAQARGSALLARGSAGWPVVAWRKNQ